jgi:hypothetical protein
MEDLRAKRKPHATQCATRRIDCPRHIVKSATGLETGDGLAYV